LIEIVNGILKVPKFLEELERHYPAFLAEMERHAHALPKYVRQEFEDYLKCDRLEHGFLRSRCETCHAEKLVAFSCKRRGFCPSCQRQITDRLVGRQHPAGLRRPCHRP
jgi:hypothetical protein